MIKYEQSNRWADLPDLLTVSRLILGIVFLFIAILGKSDFVFTVALGIFVLGVLTDVLDGYWARQINKPASLIGKHDINFDMVLTAGYLFFLGITSFMPFKVGFNLGILTALMAVLPENDIYQRPKRLVQLPGFIAITVVVAINLVSSYWFLNAVFVLIAITCLVFDRRRATELAQERKENILLSWRELQQLMVSMTRYEKFGYFLVLVPLILVYVFPLTTNYLFAPTIIGLYIVFSQHYKAKEENIR